MLILSSVPPQCPSPTHPHPPPSSPSTTPSSFPRVRSLYVLSPFLIFFLIYFLLVFNLLTYRITPSAEREREREREREAVTQAEGEAGSMQGARCWTRSRDSRIMPWPMAGAKPLSHPGIPHKDLHLFFYFF